MCPVLSLKKMCPVLSQGKFFPSQSEIFPYLSTNSWQSRSTLILARISIIDSWHLQDGTSLIYGTIQQENNLLLGNNWRSLFLLSLQLLLLLLYKAIQIISYLAIIGRHSCSFEMHVFSSFTMMFEFSLQIFCILREKVREFIISDSLNMDFYLVIRLGIFIP